MSIPDDLIMDYFELLTDVSDKELAEFRQQLAAQSVNPMILKKRLAREIVGQFHSAGAAREAESHFEKVVQQRGVPEGADECTVVGDLCWRRHLSAGHCACAAGKRIGQKPWRGEAPAGSGSYRGERQEDR